MVGYLPAYALFIRSIIIIINIIDSSNLGLC